MLKRIQYSVVKQTQIITCEYFRTITCYAKYSLLNLTGSKSKVIKMEFRLKSAFQ